LLQYQQPVESFDTSLADLRRLVKLCNFERMEDELMRDRIICGVRNEKLAPRCSTRRSSTLPPLSTYVASRRALFHSCGLCGLCRKLTTYSPYARTTQNATVHSRAAAVTILDADLTANIADADAVASNMLLIRRPAQTSVSSARIVASQITSHQSACQNDEHTAPEWSTSLTKLMTTSKRYSL